MPCCRSCRPPGTPGTEPTNWPVTASAEPSPAGAPVTAARGTPVEARTDSRPGCRSCRAPGTPCSEPTNWPATASAGPAPAGAPAAGARGTPVEAPTDSMACCRSCRAPGTTGSEPTNWPVTASAGPAPAVAPAAGARGTPVEAPTDSMPCCRSCRAPGTLGSEPTNRPDESCTEPASGRVTNVPPTMPDVEHASVVSASPWPPPATGSPPAMPGRRATRPPISMACCVLDDRSRRMGRESSKRPDDVPGDPTAKDSPAAATRCLDSMPCCGSCRAPGTPCSEPTNWPVTAPAKPTPSRVPDSGPVTAPAKPTPSRAPDNWPVTAPAKPTPSGAPATEARGTPAESATDSTACCVLDGRKRRTDSESSKRPDDVPGDPTAKDCTGPATPATSSVPMPCCGSCRAPGTPCSEPSNWSAEEAATPEPDSSIAPKTASKDPVPETSATPGAAATETRNTHPPTTCIMHPRPGRSCGWT